MNPNSYRLAAALFAAGTLTLAGANTEPAAPAPAAPNKEARSVTGSAIPADTRTFTAAPIASTVKTTGGPDAEIEAAIVQALNAEESLKGAKIAVLSEESKILLTGASMTKAQRDKATEIAVANVGDGNVVNAIVPSEV